MTTPTRDFPRPASHDAPSAQPDPQPVTRQIDWGTVRTSLEDALHDAEQIPPHTVCGRNRIEITERIEALIGRVREEEAGR